MDGERPPQVSDYDAWKEITDTHAYAATYEDAGAVGINAGLDQEGGFGTYEPVDSLPAAVAAGKTTAAKVATAFTRLMRARIRLGMFDPPTHVVYNNATYTASLQNENAAKLDLALRAGREGVTLLKNGPAGPGSAKNVLPLSIPVSGSTEVKCHAYNDTDTGHNDPENPTTSGGMVVIGGGLLSHLRRLCKLLLRILRVRCRHVLAEAFGYRTALRARDYVPRLQRCTTKAVAALRPDGRPAVCGWLLAPRQLCG
jgi:hypothetical protein